MAFIPASAAENRPADDWVSDPVSVRFLPGVKAERVSFETLRAGLAQEQLRVTWTVARSNWAAVTIWSSPEPAGGWMSRDWRPKAMRAVETGWIADLPVTDVDEPMAYFITAESPAGGTNVSFVRLCDPRGVGLSRPTALFRAFLDGFEDGHWSWWSSDERVGLRAAEGARTGQRALELTLPSGARAAAVITSRVRGGSAKAAGALGFRVWVRGDRPGAVLRVVTASDADSPRQISARAPASWTVTSEWTAVEVLFSQLRGLPVGALDQVAFEFSARGPATFWMDDLELILP